MSVNGRLSERSSLSDVYGAPAEDICSNHSGHLSKSSRQQSDKSLGTTQRHAYFSRKTRSLEDLVEADKISTAEDALIKVKFANAPPRQAFAANLLSQTKHDHNCWKMIFKIVSSPKFDTFIGVVILLNCVAIGVEIDAKEIPQRFWLIAELICICIFVAELLLKLYVFSFGYFRNKWNIFDFLVVVTGIVTVAMDFAETSGSSSAARSVQIFRTARLLRLLRIIRLYTQFQSLWLIANGLVSCIFTVSSTLVLVFGLVYFFSIFAFEWVQADGTMQKAKWSSTETIGERFASIHSTILTLCTFFTFDELGKQGWTIVSASREENRWMWVCFLLLFLLLIPVVLLNLITAVIVETSISAASKDDEHRRLVVQEEWRVVCCELEDLFLDLASCSEHDEDEDEEDEDEDEDEDVSMKATGSTFGRMVKSMVVHMKSSTADCSPRKLRALHAGLSLDKVRDLVSSHSSLSERLNLLFGEPANTLHGLDRLIEIWPILDANGDGNLTVHEFTDGLAKHHDVIKKKGGEFLLWMRLLTELSSAQKEREQMKKQQTDVLNLQRERLQLDKQVLQRLEKMSAEVSQLTTSVHQLTESQAAIQMQIQLLMQAKPLDLQLTTLSL